MKIKVEVSSELIVEFDENSEDFKELYENYKEHFCDCDYNEFAYGISKMPPFPLMCLISFARFISCKNMEG